MTAIVEMFPAPKRIEIFAAWRPSPTGIEWIVLMRDPAGGSQWWGPSKDKESAEWLAKLLAPNFDAEFIESPPGSWPSA
jgi:hypothetical protein